MYNFLFTNLRKLLLKSNLSIEDCKFKLRTRNDMQVTGTILFIYNLYFIQSYKTNM